MHRQESAGDDRDPRMLSMAAVQEKMPKSPPPLSVSCDVLGGPLSLNSSSPDSADNKDEAATRARTTPKQVTERVVPEPTFRDKVLEIFPGVPTSCDEKGIPAELALANEDKLEDMERGTGDTVHEDVDSARAAETAELSTTSADTSRDTGLPDVFQTHGGWSHETDTNTIDSSQTDPSVHLPGAFRVGGDLMPENAASTVDSASPEMTDQPPPAAQEHGGEHLVSAFLVSEERSLRPNSRSHDQGNLVEAVAVRIMTPCKRRLLAAAVLLLITAIVVPLVLLVPGPTPDPSTPEPTRFPPTPDLEISGVHVSMSSDGAAFAVGTESVVDVFSRDPFEHRGAVATSFPRGFLVSALSGDGSTIVIGGADAGQAQTGQVRVYNVSDSNSANWMPLGDELTGEPDSAFGGSVAISADGTTIAVGALNAHAESGMVRVYQISGSQWVSVASFEEEPSSRAALGRSVSLSNDGSVLAIGASQRNTVAGRGYAEIYRLNPLSSPTRLGERLEGQGISDRFGSSLSLSGDGSSVAVAAWGNDADEENVGQVNVFALSEDRWVSVGLPLTGDLAGDVFGYSVSLLGDGTILAVGAPQSFASRTGYVHVYHLEDDESWALVHNSTGETGRQSQLGYSVSLGQDSSGLYLIWGAAPDNNATFAFGVEQIEDVV